MSDKVEAHLFHSRVSGWSLRMIFDDPAMELRRRV
jgi:hypothetical protein